MYYNVSVEPLLAIVVVDFPYVRSDDKWPSTVYVVEGPAFARSPSRDVISQPDYERVVAIHDETLFQ